uniref:3-hydroxyacyl-CoA dehydrogenase type-2 n=1 Tax=Acrobeloides nanus TaxID=290746 RepID=A0A914CCG7_9BILA
MTSFIRPVKGLVSVISGGGSGLGRGVVEQLHRAGGKVAIFDLPTSKGAEVAKTLGDRGFFAPVDVRNEEQVKTAYENVVKLFGRVDVNVNCAGIAFAERPFGIAKKDLKPIDNFKTTIEVNLLGTYNMLRYAIKHIHDNEFDDMKQRGVIINTASIAAFEGQAGQAAYAASKGGIVSMTLPLARDYANDGIRFMCIAPGIFDTPLLSTLPAKVKAFLNALVPNPNRMGNPEEFGALAQHIIENRYLNGEVIRIDGALRMPP